MKNADRNNEPLDAILRRAMREQPDAATPDCANAESLAAYSDRSLSAAERERLEAHFADCMRCQVLLADIARADESARGANAAPEVPWYRRWRVAVPALAAVAAVVVFIAMRRPANEESPSGQVVAMAKHEAPAMDLAAPAPAVAPAAPAAVPAAELAAPSPRVAGSASNELAMNEPKAEAVPRAAAMSGTLLHRMAKPAEAPGARAMIAQGGATANSRGQGSYGATVTGNALSSSAGYNVEAGVLATVSPSDRSVTWIVGKNGMIRRLDARGGTHVQRSGVSADLVAGAAPSSSVCWVVGNNGTVIRTTDGEHWTPVAAPTTENFVAVSSSSANNATITAATGKSFVTSDGGASWHQQ